MKAAVLRQGVAAGLAVGMLASPVLGGLAGASLARTSAKGLYAAAIRAADKQSSLRWEASTSDSALGESIHITSVAGRVDGAQTIKVTSLGGRGVVNVRLVGKTAYILGNAFGLSQYMSFKAGPASHEANHWLAISSTNADFAPVAAGLTVNSAVSQLALPAQTRFTLLAKRKVRGLLATGIKAALNANRSHPKETLTVYVRANGLPLPIEETGRITGISQSMVLNGWGIPVHVVAPAKSVPFQTSWLK